MSSTTSHPTPSLVGDPMPEVERKAGAGTGRARRAEALKDFFAAADRCSVIAHGFQRIHVMAVPWAWRLLRQRTKRYGWVVQLWDGRRLYLTCSVGRADSRPATLAVRPMLPFEIKPDTPAPDIHWFEPSDLNAALKHDDCRQGADRSSSVPALRMAR